MSFKIVSPFLFRLTRYNCLQVSQFGKVISVNSGILALLLIHHMSSKSFSVQGLKGSPKPSHENMASKTKNMTDTKGTSIHSNQIREVHNVPMKVITRPIPSILDEVKVLSLMQTIQNPELKSSVPPIDVMWITGKEGGDYYFSFGGCHRFEAYKRLQAPTIPCKLVRSNVSDLRTYLGASTPDLR